MKTLLVGVNSKYIHPNVAIRLLKANTTYDVDLIEFNIKDPVSKMVNYILDNHYEVVGFSCYIWNSEIIKEILRTIKGKGIKVILGGPDVSYNVDYYFKEGLCDFLIKNEGEEAFHQILVYLDKGGDITTIPNLYYGLNKFTYDKIVDISKTKMAYDLLGDVKNQYVYIETSRGCPYHCGYCMASLDNKLRFFDIEEIKRQVLILINRGAKVFKFLDRTFNANKKNFLGLIDFIILHHKPYNSFEFEITGDLLDDDIIKYINKNAPKNLFRFEIGIQSTNILANRAVGRIQNNEKLFHNIRLIQDANIIDLHLDLIAGLPHEDYASFIETFNTVLSLRPKELQLGFLKLLYGTRLYNEADLYDYKWHEEAPYEIISNRYMSSDDIKLIHICEDAFDKYYNHGYFKTSINKILDYSDNYYEFFFNLGTYRLTHNGLLLEETFKILDDFIKNETTYPYEIIHSYLIKDYLNCFKIKPKAWWNEAIMPKEKNAQLRLLKEKDLLNYDLNTLYKYSLVIPLKNETIVAIYKDNKRDIISIKND